MGLVAAADTTTASRIRRDRAATGGIGVFRKAGTPYTFTAGSEGAVIADFRAHTYYSTEWLDNPSTWPAHHSQE